MAKNWKEAEPKLLELFPDKQVCDMIRDALLSKTEEERLNYFVGDNIETKAALEMLLPIIKEKGQTSSGKLNVTDAFPDGLQYLEPKPLLATIGRNWEYQPDSSLYQILRKEFKNHYEYYCKGNIDKKCMPLYLFLSGSGTGKSRNATEFCHAAVKSLDKEEDSELRSKIQNALVFNVNYENDTYLREIESADAIKTIGSRMLFQLLCTKMNFDEMISIYEAPNPEEILELVAKYKKQDIKKLTSFVVIDGLHRIMNEIDSEHKFNQTISNIGDLGCKDAFLIPCVTATFTGPISTESSQKYVFLPVPSLHPPTIYQENQENQGSANIFQQDYITNLLVDDCGGHGRTLEILQEKLVHRTIDLCNYNLLMYDLYYELSDAFNFTPTEALSIAKVILTQQSLNLYEKIPNINKTPHQLAQHGLIRFEQTGSDNSKIGYLNAPYIYVWLLAHQIGGDWKKLLNINLKTRPVAQFWQTFEHFATTLRCLKSRVIGEGESTAISEIHAGARLNGDIKFINQYLELEITKKQEPTDSNRFNGNIECEHDNIDIQQGKHCIINRENTQSGDSFLCLKQSQTETLNEVHRYKLWSEEKIDQKVYLQERNKAASKDDFFILFTTQNCDEFKLPENSGIVDKGNWTKYFGPFAGRASIFAAPPDINTVNRTILQQMNNIDPEHVRKIRSQRPFTDITNAIKTTGMRVNLLEKFRFPTKKYHSLAHASRVICRNISHFI